MGNNHSSTNSSASSATNVPSSRHKRHPVQPSAVSPDYLQRSASSLPLPTTTIARSPRCNAHSDCRLPDNDENDGVLPMPHFYESQGTVPFLKTLRHPARRQPKWMSSGSQSSMDASTSSPTGSRRRVHAPAAENITELPADVTDALRAEVQMPTGELDCIASGFVSYEDYEYIAESLHRIFEQIITTNVTHYRAKRASLAQQIRNTSSPTAAPGPASNTLPSPAQATESRWCMEKLLAITEYDEVTSGLLQSLSDAVPEIKARLGKMPDARVLEYALLTSIKAAGTDPAAHTLLSMNFSDGQDLIERVIKVSTEYLEQLLSVIPIGIHSRFGTGYFSPSEPVISPVVTCGVHVGRTREFFVSMESRLKLIDHRAKFQRPEDIVQCIAYLSNFVSHIVGSFTLTVLLSCALHLRHCRLSAAARAAELGYAGASIDPPYAEGLEKVATTTCAYFDKIGTEGFNMLRRRFPNVFILDSVQSEGGRAPTLAVVVSLLTKLIFLFAGGLNSISADDRCEPALQLSRLLEHQQQRRQQPHMGQQPAKPFPSDADDTRQGVPEDVALATALQIHSLQHLILMGGLMDLDGTTGRRPLLADAQACAAVWRVCFQFVGLLPHGKHCPPDMRQWIHCFPFYVLPDRAKRSMLYVHAILSEQQTCVLSPVLREDVLQSAAALLQKMVGQQSPAEETERAGGAQEPDADASPSALIYPTFASLVQGMEAGGGHVQRKELYELCAAECTAAFLPPVDITPMARVVLMHEEVYRDKLVLLEGDRKAKMAQLHSQYGQQAVVVVQWSLQSSFRPPVCVGDHITLHLHFSPATPGVSPAPQPQPSLHPQRPPGAPSGKAQPVRLVPTPPPTVGADGVQPAGLHAKDAQPSPCGTPSADVVRPPPQINAYRLVVVAVVPGFTERQQFVVLNTNSFKEPVPTVQAVVQHRKATPAFTLGHAERFAWTNTAYHIPPAVVAARIASGSDANPLSSTASQWSSIKSQWASLPPTPPPPLPPAAVAQQSRSALEVPFAIGWLLGNALANSVVFQAPFAPLIFRLFSRALKFREPVASMRLTFADIALLSPSWIADTLRAVFSDPSGTLDKVRSSIPPGGAPLTELLPQLVQQVVDDFLWNVDGGDQAASRVFWSEMLRGVQYTSLASTPLFLHCCARTIRDLLCGRVDSPSADFRFKEEFLLFFESRPHPRAYHEELCHQTLFCLENDFTVADRRRLLRFTTGRELLPLLPRSVVLQFLFYSNEDVTTAADCDRELRRLPSSHPCDHVLEIPNYMDYLLMGSGGGNTSAAFASPYAQQRLAEAGPLTAEDFNTAWRKLSPAQVQAIGQAYRATLLARLRTSIYESRAFDEDESIALRLPRYHPVSPPFSLAVPRPSVDRPPEGDPPSSGAGVPVSAVARRPTVSNTSLHTIGLSFQGGALPMDAGGRRRVSASHAPQPQPQPQQPPPPLSTSPVKEEEEEEEKEQPAAVPHIASTTDICPPQDYLLEASTQSSALSRSNVRPLDVGALDPHTAEDDLAAPPPVHSAVSFVFRRAHASSTDLTSPPAAAQSTGGSTPAKSGGHAAPYKVPHSVMPTTRTRIAAQPAAAVSAARPERPAAGGFIGISPAAKWAAEETEVRLPTVRSAQRSLTSVPSAHDVGDEAPQSSSPVVLPPLSAAGSSAALYRSPDAESRGPPEASRGGQRNRERRRSAAAIAFEAEIKALFPDKDDEGIEF